MRVIQRVVVGLFGLALTACGGAGGGADGASNTPAGNNPPGMTVPTVLSASPAANSVDVALNAALTATFSEAMDSTTLNTATFTLYQGANAVPGTVTYSAATATFTPSNSLANGMQYIATIISGAKDLAGDALAVSYTWSFVTHTAGAAPTVLSTSPTANGVDVPVTASLTATFSEPMSTATLNTATFTVYQGANPVPGTVTYNGVTATFASTNPLAKGIQYTATITTGAQDLAGDALATNFAWSFTTQTKAWGTAALIETGTGQVFDPQISVDANGNAIAVWRQTDSGASSISSVLANRYSAASGTWGIAVLLENGANSAGSPKIVIDSQGNAIVVWLQFDGAFSSVYANHYNATSNTWGSAVLIETGAVDVYDIDITIDTSGNALAVWEQNDSAGIIGLQDIYANRYNASNKTWGTATLVEAGAGSKNGARIQLAADSNGNATLAWLQETASFNIVAVYAKHYSTIGNIWGAKTLISTGVGAANFPDIAVDKNGNAMVVWQQFNTNIDIYANRYNVTSNSWGTATLIEGNAGSATEPHLGIDTSGNALVVWHQLIGAYDNVYFNRYNAANNTWGTAALVVAANTTTSIGGVEIAVDGPGNALVMSTPSSDGLVRASHYTAASNTWSPAVAISATSGSLIDVAVNPSSIAFAVWRGANPVPVAGSSGGSIFANRLQ
jgi:Bacterial Ig-like domain